ncbi:cyclic GMP-AMP synthase-like receptor isoform X2 [Watersipora subatra]|uniref:cyclic GMP-AMP synthase-like receptor isoform X2 n=1 Tax=Watersipora subatra TaxID=2589382 RepID=UPI00355B7137
MESRVDEILTTLKRIKDRLENLEVDVKEIKKQTLGKNSASQPDGLQKGDVQATSRPEQRKLLSRPSGDDSELGKMLRSIEHHHLSAELSENEKTKPALVQFVGEKFILPSLEICRSGVSYMGSTYEFTALPGKSDFDIQFFVKLPISKHNGKKVGDAEVLESDDAAWKFVKGGPVDLLDEAGYLSAEKTRKLVLSTVDKALKMSSVRLEFKGDTVEITRSTSGPAITLNVKWRGETVSIDIVVCLKAADMKNSKFDLVAKPYAKSSTTLANRYWRLSYSSHELKLLREFHSKHPRKNTLLRIMKLIKQHHSQLRIFPSYFYKNILFLMVKKDPFADWDTKADLAPRSCLGLCQAPVRGSKT